MIPSPTLTSRNPWDGTPVTEVPLASPADCRRKVDASRAALADWSADPAARREIVTRVAGLLKARRDGLARLISRETGKVLWESLAEVDAMANKCALSIRAEDERHASITKETSGGGLATTYRPHGVALVLGPFNFPGHLPWGHIAPALLAGNTVIFKPSERAPGVAQYLAGVLKDAGLPEGVLHVLHGGADVATALLDADIDAVMFTGSYAVGTRILSRLATRPGVMTALEMGGNNPIVAWDVADTRAAVLAVLQSAFATAGQRCSCARRLIIRDGDPLLDAVVDAAAKLMVGKWDEAPPPFCSTVIDARAADAVVAASEAQGRPLLPVRRDDRSPALLRPGVVDVTDAAPPDDEVFGPLLRVQRVKSFDAALRVANRTRYGLAAGLLTDDPALWRRFRLEARAGVLTLNRPTTGASSELPFGGVGDSGNHRPAAYFAADYCAYPVAEMSSPTVSLPSTLPPGIML